ncbi:MAG TPA: tetratricopeptide repeat protein [Candidatus Eisenbacteria bacterium]|jgi:tetratricopeptide (TPR) repeat protein
MTGRTIWIACLLGGLAAPPAFASFGGSKSEEPPRPETGISSVSLTPRQEAERLYADAYDEITKAKKDLEEGKEKNAAKKFKKALDRGERAVSFDAKYHEAWNLVGYAARKLKDYDRALAAYEKCLALKPDYAPAREYLGEAYVELGKLDKAHEQLAWLERAAAATTEARDLKKAIADYEAAHGAPADAGKAGAPADSSQAAPADTSASGHGGR